MVKQALIKVVDLHNLSIEEMETVMREIQESRLPSSLIAAFITALRMKGESIDEITGAARAMRHKATRIPLKSRPVALENEDTGLELETILDTCGTGGDSTSTFNVSTTSAFVA